MLRIAWKSFWANMRNFLAFFISIIMAVNMLFLLRYIREAVSHIKGVETKALAFAYSSEQARILGSVTPAVVLVAVIVVAYSVQFYVQSRMRDYSMLTVLGIRKKDMRKMIMAEYALCGGLSCILGLVLGKLCSLLLGKWLEIYTEQSFVDSIRMGRVYGMTALLCVALIVGVVLAIRILMDHKDITETAKQKVMKEKRITSGKSYVFLAMGICLTASGLVIVWKKPYWFIFAMFIICLGVFFSVSLGLGGLLEWFRESGHYRKRILEWDWFYHYFSRSKFQIMIQAMIGIVVLSFAFIMLRGTFYGRKMPNDFACVTQEGSGFPERFAEQFGGEQKTFPFVWVNESAGDSYIGISVSDYNRLFDGHETLREEEAVMIWREDDLVLEEETEKRENLYLGHCANSESTGTEEYTHEFQIKKEEQKELLGFSLIALMVLPDDVVENAAEAEDFHQEFMLFNVDGSQLEDATAYVEDARDEGMLEEAFCRKTIEDIDRKESILNRMIAGVIAVTVIFFSIFVVWLMSFAELEQRKERYRFLKISGMREKERKRNLRKELGRTIWIPAVLTLLLAGTLCQLFISGYYGDGASHVLTAKVLLGVILLGYAGMELLFLTLSRTWMQKRILGVWGMSR